MCDPPHPHPPSCVRVTCPVPRPQVLSPAEPRALAIQHTLRNSDIISQASTLTVALRALGLIGERSLRPRNRGTGLDWLLPAFILILLSFQESAPQLTCRISGDVPTWLACFKSRVTQGQLETVLKTPDRNIKRDWRGRSRGETGPEIDKMTRQVKHHESGSKIKNWPMTLLCSCW